MGRSPWGLSLARILAALEVSAGAVGCGGNAETTAESPSEEPTASGGATPEGTGGRPEGTGGLSDVGSGGYDTIVTGRGTVGAIGPQFPIDRAAFEGVADPELLDALVENDPAVLGTLCTTPEPDAYYWLYECLELADPGANCSDVYTTEDAAAVYGCGLQQGADVVCGPALVLRDGGASCCYFVGGGCPVGRPFFVDSVARRARPERRSDWLKDLRPELSELDARTRAALSQLYLEEALSEHASVAAFSRFVLQCLAQGAPADIVEAAIRACAEEVEHAKFAFSVSSHYAGEARGPGPLEISGALAAGEALEDVVLSTVREGCIAETVSAHLIAAARDAASEPVIKRSLSIIFEQEMEHTLLAWRFVAWALASGSLSSSRRERLLGAIEEVFLVAEEWVGWGPVLDREEEGRLSQEQLRAHGYIPVSEREAVAHSVLGEVVRPAALALLRAVPEKVRSPSCSAGREATRHGG